MKLLLSFILSVTALNCLAQAPLNDNFENRILLLGDDVIFGGTVDGATREEYEPCIVYCDGFPTIWWSWLTSNTCNVAIQIVTNGQFDGMAMTSVFVGNNITTLTNVTYIPWSTHFEFGATFRHHFRALGFRSQPGIEYQISATAPTGGVAMRLVASNCPIILESPSDKTVSPNQSVWFNVLASGGSPLRYQWRFNGTNLPGETTPLLTFHNASTNHEGEYSVIVSDDLGTNRAAARLIVAQNDSPPILSARLLEGNLRMTINGDVGRGYLLEVSSNLSSWNYVRSIESVPAWRKLVITTNGGGFCSLPINSLTKFVRVSKYVPSNEVCVANLQQIKFAKALWANETRQGDPSECAAREIIGYFKDAAFPECPIGGTYTIGPVQMVPECSVMDWRWHFLEEP